jgi:hypothetical protein
MIDVEDKYYTNTYPPSDIYFKAIKNDLKNKL